MNAKAVGLPMPPCSTLSALKMSDTHEAALDSRLLRSPSLTYHCVQRSKGESYEPIKKDDMIELSISNPFSASAIQLE